MKKGFTLILLILVMALLVGLSAPAWAADIIIITSSVPAAIGPDEEATISGTMPLNVVSSGPSRTDITYTVTSAPSAGTLNFNADAGTFSVKIKGSQLPSDGTVTLYLNRTTTVYVENEEPVSTTEDDIYNTNFHIYLALPVNLAANNFLVTCSDNHGGLGATANGANAFAISIPATCSGDTVTIKTNLSSDNFTVTFDNSAASGASSLIYAPSSNGGPAEVTVTNKAGTSKTYNLTVTRAAASKSILKSVTVNATSGSTSYGSVGPISGTSGGHITTLKVDANTPDTVKINWALPDDGSATLKSAKWNGTSGAVIANGDSATMPTGVNTRDLVLEIQAGDGNPYTETIRISRNAASGTVLLSSVSASASSGGSSLGTPLTNITTDNLTPNMAINTSADYFDMTVVPGSNKTMTYYRWDTGNWTAISGGNTSKKIVNLSAPASGRSKVLQVRVVNSSTPTQTPDVVSITVTNSTSGGTLLASAVNIRTGANSSSSSVGNSNTLITSTSSAQTITINNSGSTFYAHFSLYSGVTLTDPYNNTNNNVVQLDMPTSINSKRFTIDFNVGSNTYSTDITLQRGSDNAILKSVTLKNGSNTLGSLGAINGGGMHSLGLNNTTYSTANVSWVLADGASIDYARWGSSGTNLSNGASVTLPTGSNSTDLVFRIRARDNVYYSATIRVTRSGSSSQATLSSLRVAEQMNSSSSYQYTLAPAFDSSVTEYTVLIPYANGDRDIYVQGTLRNNNDTLTIDGSDPDSNGWVSVNSVRPGNNKRIQVKVEDNGGYTTIYYLNIVAAASNADNDANLSTLYLRSGSSGNTNINISPSFNTNTTSYTADSVANTVDSIRVYADSRSGANPAAIVVNNALVNSSGYATVNLAEGSNSLRVTVYAEDCKASKTYTISINRGASGSSDSTLSGLEVQVRAGTGVNQTYNLIPAFNKAIFNYSSNVNDDVTLVSFRPTATDSGAQIYMSGSYITSGQWTANTSVNSGANTFSFQVTSADGSNTSTYTLTVQRGLRVGPSTQTLWVDGKQITCAAYNINGNNYFKLRDLAYALKGTSKHFNVTYNAATRVVSMISNQEYSPIGGEMVMPGSYKKCIPTNQTIMLDNRNVSLIVYNIDGNNYFMLREIGALFDFGVTYNDADRRVDVNTSIGYTPDIRWSN